MACWTTRRSRRSARATRSATCRTRSCIDESQSPFLCRAARAARHLGRGSRAAGGRDHGCGPAVVSLGKGQFLEGSVGREEADPHGGEPGHGRGRRPHQGGRRDCVLFPGDRRMKISVQEKDFDMSAETRLLSKDKRVGAIASFVGLVREVPMTLEHYPGMTENAITKIAQEAGGRRRGLGWNVVHPPRAAPGGG